MEHQHPERGILEAEKVRHLDNKRALDELTAQRVPAVVINQVEIAQGVMNEVETDVRAHLVRVGVILKEPIEKQPRRKSVTQARANQSGPERAIRQIHPVVAVIHIDVHMIIRSPIQSAAEGLAMAIPELTQSDIDVSGNLPSLAAVEAQ